LMRNVRTRNETSINYKENGASHCSEKSSLAAGGR
jgi:hypothetical protein